MKVFVLVDWEMNFVIGVYQCEAEANNDRDRFINKKMLEVVKRDLIE